MSNILKFSAAVAAFLTLGQVSSHAQATRTWVSGVGDDANPCSRTAPCKTFAGAISKTAINGSIDCIDPGAYGAVTITKSISIDCHEHFAGVLGSGTNGIIINIPTPSPTDPQRSVRIRNLVIDGSGSNTRTGLKGIRIISANAVYIEDTLIRNFTQEGIRDERIAGGALFINNTTVQDNTLAGISITPASGAVRIDASIANSIVERSTDGIKVGSGARVMVKRAIISGHSGAGISVAGPAGAARVTVDDSVISSNGTGIVRGGGGAANLSNNDIANNATGKTGVNLVSFGNNRLSNNTADGDAFVAAAQQ
jgi:Right handed beta helix region